MPLQGLPLFMLAKASTVDRAVPVGLWTRVVPSRVLDFEQAMVTDRGAGLELSCQHETGRSISSTARPQDEFSTDSRGAGDNKRPACQRLNSVSVVSNGAPELTRQKGVSGEQHQSTLVMARACRNVQ